MVALRCMGFVKLVHFEKYWTRRSLWMQKCHFCTFECVNLNLTLQLRSQASPAHIPAPAEHAGRLPVAICPLVPSKFRMDFDGYSWKPQNLLAAGVRLTPREREELSVRCTQAKVTELTASPAFASWLQQKQQEKRQQEHQRPAGQSNAQTSTACLVLVAIALFAAVTCPFPGSLTRGISSMVRAGLSPDPRNLKLQRQARLSGYCCTLTRLVRRRAPPLARMQMKETW